MPDSRIIGLLRRFFNDNDNIEEQREVEEILAGDTHEEEIFLAMDATWKENLDSGRSVFSTEKSEEMLQGILKVKILSTKTGGRKWWKVAVAAAVLLVAGALWFVIDRGGKKASTDQPIVQDVKSPESNRAMITLANGERVYLDSAGTGVVAKQGGVSVVKNERGELVYKGNAAKVEYNELVNPRGSKIISLTLSDGTKVWLDSESSLKYPTAFVGTDRLVEITGQAYFEVAKNGKQFQVKKGDVQVNVLGTHFNVKAYEDEEGVRVTLLEGSVEVKSQNEKVKIMPGQQAVTLSNGQLTVNNNVDVEEVMAWKNGLFSFNDVDIRQIMREVARWYDVEVAYEGSPSTEKFRGKISRSSSLNELMKILALSGVNWKIEGKKIILK